MAVSTTAHAIGNVGLRNVDAELGLELLVLCSRFSAMRERTSTSVAVSAAHKVILGRGVSTRIAPQGAHTSGASRR